VHFQFPTAHFPGILFTKAKLTVPNRFSLLLLSRSRHCANNFHDSRHYRRMERFWIPFNNLIYNNLRLRKNSPLNFSVAAGRRLNPDSITENVFTQSLKNFLG